MGGVEGQAPVNAGSWNGEHHTEATVDCGAGGSSPGHIHIPRFGDEGRILRTCIFNKLPK